MIWIVLMVGLAIILITVGYVLTAAFVKVKHWLLKDTKRAKVKPQREKRQR